MIVTATLDVSRFTVFMNDFEKRQVPYAAMLALNWTAEDAQRAVKNRIRAGVFRVRSEVSAQWLSNQIKFYPRDRATKQRFSALIQVDPTASKGGKRNALLPLFEHGFMRRSAMPIGSANITIFARGSIAIPNRDGNPMRQIDRALYPTMLGLQARRAITGTYQYVRVKKGRPMQAAGLKGKRRTFVVRSAGQTGGEVRQRVGPGKRDTILLFRIRPPRPVAARPFFFDVAQQVASQRMLLNFQRGFDEAMRTAR